MATKGKSYDRLTSPKGTAMYPYLDTPDTKFDSDGVYRLNLIVSGEEGIQFVDQLTEYHNNYYDEFCARDGKALKKANLPIKPVVDEDGNETGDHEIRFKMKAVGKSKDRTWQQRPVVYDAKATPITGDTLSGMNIGNGTECKVAFEVIPFHTGMAGMGISLRMRSVQILNLVEYKPQHDFVAEEGYTVESSTSDF